jgi:hypothetical protein
MVFSAGDTTPTDSGPFDNRETVWDLHRNQVTAIAAWVDSHIADNDVHADFSS